MKPDLPLTPGLAALRFDNALVRELPADAECGARLRQVHGAVYSLVEPEPVPSPSLLAYSPELAAALGLNEADIRSDAFTQVFAGNALLPGMQPFASNYGGHQFGHWAGQLGDGRAISLGEVISSDGQRHELQLKGAGSTPYSRHADGRAVLRSSIREFLCSEAMHHLGVPTTRALSLMSTGQPVLRDMFYDGHAQHEPGAVVCRVAPSFLRFGHFELPASRGDTALLRQLAQFCIRRDFPQIQDTGRAAYAQWFHQIATRTAQMVAHWMRVGFVHGVMNTDNLSVLGLTIDYGPYGWVEDYDPDFTPNTTDLPGRRYRFAAQPQIAHWNLTRLAGALAPLFDGDVQPLQAGLAAYASHFQHCDDANTAAKLGLAQCGDDARLLMADLRQFMHAASADMTLLFRTLGAVDADELHPQQFADCFYDADKRQQHAEAFAAWLSRYQQRVATDALDAQTRRQRMSAANPAVIPRNWLVQQAIMQAENGDASGIHSLLEAFRHPYEEAKNPEHRRRRPGWAANAPGCAMLSCSS